MTETIGHLEAHLAQSLFRKLLRTDIVQVVQRGHLVLLVIVAIGSLPKVRSLASVVTTIVGVQ